MSALVDSPARLSMPVRRMRPIERHGGLDWLRAFATILVVLLHAGIPYLTQPLPGVVWSVESAERSSAVNLCCWWINGFIMPLFFLMSGFFACELRERLGTGGFLRHRLHRIGGPLLFGMIVILPLDLYAWLLGWVQQGWIPAQKLRSLKIDSPLGDQLWGLAHLWFLEYLLLYCLAGWAICRVLDWRVRRRVESRRTAPVIPLPAVSGSPWGRSVSVNERLLAGGTALLGAVAICGTVLTVEPEVVIGFRHGWLPLWENAIFFAVPFAIGWGWAAFRKKGPTGSEAVGNGSEGVTWWLPAGGLVLATGMFVTLLPRLEAHLTRNETGLTDPGLAYLFAGFGLLMSVSLFGIALLSSARQAPAGVRYFAQASFWIYLLHHPLVGLVHVDLWSLAWPAWVKFLVAALVPLTLCLLTYQIVVRRTFIGLVLNGRHATQRPAGATVEPVAESAPTRQAA
jgi:glucans biosynthesis protein C